MKETKKEQKFEYKKYALYTEKVFKQYHCRNCNHSFIPFPRQPEKNQNAKPPTRCPKCKSRKWFIPIKWVESCIRCGAFWDRRDYPIVYTRNQKCPKCGRKDYRREDWEQQINYKRIIKEEKKIAEKEEQNAGQLIDAPKTKFKRSVHLEDDEKEDTSIIGRLL